MSTLPHHRHPVATRRAFQLLCARSATLLATIAAPGMLCYYSTEWRLTKSHTLSGYRPLADYRWRRPTTWDAAADAPAALTSMLHISKPHHHQANLQPAGRYLLWRPVFILDLEPKCCRSKNRQHTSNSVTDQAYPERVVSSMNPRHISTPTYPTCPPHRQLPQRRLRCVPSMNSCSIALTLDLVGRLLLPPASLLRRSQTRLDVLLGNTVFCGDHAPPRPDGAT